jgi:hypothetical protein
MAEQLMDLNSFMNICKFLPTGMILRCGAVCKKWNTISNNDDVWILILGVELYAETGLSPKKNICLNRQIAVLWKSEFQQKHKGDSVKEVYMRLRRNKIKWMSKSRPGYSQRMRIFHSSKKEVLVV